MSEYKGVNRSYFELVELFKTKIVEPLGETEDSKRKKYFAVLELVADLKASFQYYYEYELLRLVLKDYNDILSEQLNFRKIQIFTPSTSIINANETENLVLNTVTQSSQKQRALFGEVPIKTSTLQKTDIFNNLQEEDFGIIFKIKSCSIDSNDTMYNFTCTTFVGFYYCNFIHYLYLQKFRLKNYSDQSENNSENFQLFNIDYKDKYGFYYRKKFLTDNKYLEQIHQYFETHDNCFTLVPTTITGHFLTTFIHKNGEGIHIYVIDSNSIPYDEFNKLTQALKDLFQKRHRTVRCESYYMGTYALNFGGENGNIYEEEGYCILVGYLFMNILFRNIVIYKKLPFNATQKQVFNFINSMKRYCI